MNKPLLIVDPLITVGYSKRDELTCLIRLPEDMPLDHLAVIMAGLTQHIENARELEPGTLWREIERHYRCNTCGIYAVADVDWRPT